MKYSILLIIFCYFSFLSSLMAQESDSNIFGDVQCNGEHIPLATIHIEGTTIGTTTDISGHYMMLNLPIGKNKITATALGYKDQTIEITISKNQALEVNFRLEEEHITLDHVVVTGTRTFKRQIESAVIVGVIDSRTLENIQANTLSESLNFQSGLRMETDCQTCSYSQLRINGMGGAYTQILINNRPIFSPLMGLYGMEQIPASMIDRVEVVKGGASALYGSSAIGGTVNVLTKMPDNNSYEFGFNQSMVDLTANDQQIHANASLVSQQGNAGLSLYALQRNRSWWDENNDNYSEIPRLKDNTFGFTAFFKPTFYQKLELSINSLYEYRYGGEMVEDPAYLAEQSEERTHNILLGSLDYQWLFNNNNSSLSAYIAGQKTKRKHYTGVKPDDPVELQAHLENPPYGTTDNETAQIGAQINHLLEDFWRGENNVTFGTEYLYDDVLDEVPAYQTDGTPFTDQTVRNWGMFLQSDWEFNQHFTLLTGVRMDDHNFVDNLIFTPRVSLLYRIKNTQFRGSWATGFRAPQAFDTDLHIAFTGGGISRIVLDPSLKEERSNSLNFSANYDNATENYIFGGTADLFYTVLKDAFITEEIGEDELGTIFEKRNGGGAVSKGVNFEFRANLDRKIQVELGYTILSSKFDEAVLVSEQLEPERKFLRTPEHYGFLMTSYTPTKQWTATLNATYTGEMKLVHFAGAPELPTNDVYVTTDSFFDLGAKASYRFTVPSIDTKWEVFVGAKNIFNAYQDDFDSTKDRDSNYIYGPALPFTLTWGVKIKGM